MRPVSVRERREFLIITAPRDYQSSMQEGSYIPFALEIHSPEPERLVAFYEDLLGVKFSATTYPFPRYLATVGQFALIITTSREKNRGTDFEPGTITLALLSSASSPAASEQYLLYPQRPLGGRFPSRYAGRLRDPDGNYVAFAAPMAYSQVRTPPITSWQELGESTRDLMLMTLERSRIWARRQWDRANDAYEYATNHVSIVDRELGGYTHLVASRRGIFAVNATSYKQLLRGRFFGLTIRGNDIYCFQTCGDDNVGRPLRQHDGVCKGRLLRLRIENNRITDVTVLLAGLDDNCHQIDFVEDNLLIVDCHNGRILKLTPSLSGYESYYPLGRMDRKVAALTYHMNSIAGHPDGNVWVLLHNYNKRPSEILVLNCNFEIIRRFEVSAGSAHNIVFTNDELEYLVADSYGGRIVSASGPVVEGLTMIPRGLSLDDSTCVFGESLFETRLFRRYIPGRIHFAERRTWRVFATLELPAAPTDIRRIDGKDLSLSNYVRKDWSEKRNTEVFA